MYQFIQEYIMYHFSQIHATDTCHVFRVSGVCILVPGTRGYLYPVARLRLSGSVTIASAGGGTPILSVGKNGSGTSAGSMSPLPCLLATRLHARNMRTQ